jgi:hypothetical protein
MIYTYFKFARLEGKKRTIVFALGYPLLNFVLITAILMGMHSKYKSEFTDPPPYISYEIPDGMKIEKGKDYKRSKELLAAINTLSDKRVFAQFDLEIDVNRSQEFLIDDIFSGALYRRWKRETEEAERTKIAKEIREKAIAMLTAEKKAEAEEYDEPYIPPTKEEINGKIQEVKAAQVEAEKPKENTDKKDKGKTKKVVKKEKKKPQSKKSLGSYSVKEMNKMVDLMLKDPMAKEKVFFVCLPNVKQKKSYGKFCKKRDFEAYFAASAQTLIYYGLKGKDFKRYQGIVDKITNLLVMQDEQAGTDVGAAYQDDFFKYKLKLFNIYKILVSHHKVKKQFQKPLRKSVKKFFPRDKEGNKKRWRYVNVVFDKFVRDQKIELIKLMQEPVFGSEKASFLKIMALRYFHLTGTLGFLLNTEYHKGVREKYMDTVWMFIKRRTTFTKVDIEFEARRAVRFERNSLNEILQKHFTKNKPLLNFYGKFLFFEFMRTQGFAEFKRIWEIEYFLEEAVDFVID